MEQLAKTLNHKPEGRGFDLPRFHWKFSSIKSFRLTMALGPAQPLITGG